MFVIGLALDVALLALVAFIVYRVVTLYRSTTGTVKERLLATAWGSATMLAGFATTIGSTIMIYSDTVLETLNLPDVQALLKDNVSPKVMGYVVLGTTALIVAGRLRTLFRGLSS